MLSQCPMFIAKIPKTLTDIPHLLRALWFGRFGPGCQRRSSFNQRTLHRACLMVWYFVWYYHNIKYDIVWYGGSATPGYSLSWMTHAHILRSGSRQFGQTDASSLPGEPDHHCCPYLIYHHLCGKHLGLLS